MTETKQPAALTLLLRDKIIAQGPISIAEYMELALSHPEHGYYMTRDPFGARGDFVTSPEISQIFGELIGAWAADLWHKMGGGAFALVECGPGRGTLMADLLRATRHVKGFHEHASIHMIEISPTLAHAQYTRLRNDHPRIEWLDNIAELPVSGAMILIANEFFDALPIKQHVHTAQGLCERRVGWDETIEAFCFVLSPPGLSLAKSATVIAEGTVVETSPVARDVMRQIAARIHAQGGGALIIDYGYLGENHRETLQAVKHHLYHPILTDVGKADITAHVDFTTLMEVARGERTYTHGLISQGQFLARMGIELRLEALLKRALPEQHRALIEGVTRLISPQAMGDLFKVMALTSRADIIPAGF